MKTEYYNLVDTLNEEAIKATELEEHTVRIEFKGSQKGDSSRLELTPAEAFIPGFIAAKHYNSNYTRYYSLESIRCLTVKKDDYTSIAAIQRAARSLVKGD